MSRLQISRSADLKHLRDEGYDIEVKTGGILLVKDVPYVNAKKEVKRGVLISKLKLTNNVTDTPRDDHVAYFIGEHPCNADGTEIIGIKNASNPVTLGDGLVAEHTFSAKPFSGQYRDYHHKITTYVTALIGPAHQIDPNVTAKTFPLVQPETEDSIFVYEDTASSRADIMVATEKLKGQKVAIVGGGGTGSYVLDFVSKTPVREIHLYDHDVFSQHNAFRSPGAATSEELGQKLSKVAYLAKRYSNMHRGVIPHEVLLDQANIEELRGLTFVFLCIDRPEAKKPIVEKLEELDIPFADVGMGLHIADASIGGMIRVTTSIPGRRDGFREHISFEGTGDGLYDKNIQVAELNAMNAIWAVIKWKKLCGFYADFVHELRTTYTVDGNLVVNSDMP